jgi:hypothetical protein
LRFPRGATTVANTSSREGLLRFELKGCRLECAERWFHVQMAGILLCTWSKSGDCE